MADVRRLAGLAKVFMHTYPFTSILRVKEAYQASKHVCVPLIEEKFLLDDDIDELFTLINLGYLARMSLDLGFTACRFADLAQGFYELMSSWEEDVVVRSCSEGDLFLLTDFSLQGFQELFVEEIYHVEGMDCRG